LYAINIDGTTAQLYTVDINTGAATPTSSNFPSVGADYNLTGNQRFGFDFNPSTLQADTSMRIRLVATNGDNLRINSNTGALASIPAGLARLANIASDVLHLFFPTAGIHPERFGAALKRNLIEA